MSADKGAVMLDQKYFYTSDDFTWHCIVSDEEQNEYVFTQFDKEIRQRWNAAVDASCFAYKLDHVEGRVVPGKYQIYIQHNEMRFNKRRQPQVMNSVSQPFNPDKFNFTKVKSKEVLFELCPHHRSSGDEHNLMIINISPLEYRHCLLAPAVNKCLPQVLTEESILLALETSLLSNHRGFHVGFNSLCAHASVNHLHFHTWYSQYPSYLDSAEVSPICEDVFEVRNYPTNAFVFELAPETDVCSLARKIHKVTTYFIENEIAHNFHIMRGTRCYSNPQINGAVRQEDGQRYSVLRVFLWPRNPVHGAKDLSSYQSERRPIAVYEFAGSLAIDTKEKYDSFTEEDFCAYLSRASLAEEVFIRHKEAIRELLSSKNST